MKIYDKIILTKDKKKYSCKNIYKDDIGTIINAEIRDESFNVAFHDKKEADDYIFCAIDIEDMKLYQSGLATDKQILEELPKNDPRWWCKVEDGYIMNLLGEKKNKIPYKYNS